MWNRWKCQIGLGLLLLTTSLGEAFSGVRQSPGRYGTALAESGSEKAERLRNQADELRGKAEALRKELGQDAPTAASPVAVAKSKWDLKDPSQSLAYRLYVDIGREEGTWMDPRWGASGKRLEFTLDVAFQDEVAAKEVASQIVKDNMRGKSTPVKVLQTAGLARLRSGFDQMVCRGGAYRIDMRNGQKSLRFCVQADGTPENAYGDVDIPAGGLHFSLPVFGQFQLSSKPGPVTVRQVGWNTGLRREESRIVGTFRVKPLGEAKTRYKY